MSIKVTVAIVLQNVSLLSQTISKLTCKLNQLNRWKIFDSFWNLIQAGMFDREGVYIKFWLRGEGFMKRAFPVDLKFYCPEIGHIAQQLSL